MAGKDIITMSQRELKRLHVIHQVLEKRLKQKDAANLLELCERQINRIASRVKQEGDDGIIHRSRGKPSHNLIPEARKKRVLKLYRAKYKGFGPLLATEKLFEIDKIRISDETLRKWLMEEGEWKKSRKHKKHRQWRERKHHVGQMIQVDGSHHDWLEGRGPKCVLMLYVDDATSRRYARFYDYEGTFPFMDSFKRYIKRYGLPHSVYIDKHSTYKSPKDPSIEDQLNNREPLSQVGRALKELTVEVIYAESAPAKGRVERNFKTCQDRLVKELRLHKIKTIDEANAFLKHWLPVFNKRFGVPPVKEANLHRKLPKGIDLDTILCIKEDHPLRNDFTVTYDKKLFQVLEHTKAKRVTVQERANGRIFIAYKGRYLRHKQITQRPVKKVPKKAYVFKLKKVWKPPMDHPYKAPMFGRRYPHINSYSQKEKVAQKEKGLLLTKT